MAKITRLAGNLKAFASDAVGLERTVFGGVTQDDTLSGNIVTDFLRGWGIIGPTDIPTKQDFNALGFTSTQLSAYLHQAGVAEWDAAQEYYIGGVTNRNGSLYTALTNNTNKAPESFLGVDWRDTAPAAPTATETVEGVAEIATQAETDAGSDDVRFITPQKLRWGTSFLIAQNGYIVFPSWLGGLIIQWGDVLSGSDQSSVNVSFPISFPNAAYQALVTLNGSHGNTVEGYSYNNLSLTGLSLLHTGDNGPSEVSWFAIGK